MGYGGSPCGRPMNAPTDKQQLSYKIKIASMPYSGINAIHLSKLSPRKDCGGTPPTFIFNFQFSIFNLQSSARKVLTLTLIKLSSRTGNGGTPCGKTSPSVVKMFFDDVKILTYGCLDFLGTSVDDTAHNVNGIVLHKVLNAF